METLKLLEFLLTCFSHQFKWRLQWKKKKRFGRASMKEFGKNIKSKDVSSESSTKIFHMFIFPMTVYEWKILAIIPEKQNLYPHEILYTNHYSTSKMTFNRWMIIYYLEYLFHEILSKILEWAIITCSNLNGSQGHYLHCKNTCIHTYTERPHIVCFHLYDITKIKQFFF